MLIVLQNGEYSLNHVRLASLSLPGCACRKSNPNIFVVQSAEDWAAKNAPCPLHGARSGRVLIQGQVRARLIIVASVRFQNAAQMHLAQDNDVVQTLPADRSDQPFGKAVLPG